MSYFVLLISVIRICHSIIVPISALYCSTFLSFTISSYLYLLFYFDFNTPSFFFTTYNLDFKVQGTLTIPELIAKFKNLEAEYL